MTHRREGLSELHLEPEAVVELPALARNKLIGFLLRWEHFESARCCLHELTRRDAKRVGPYDNLARAYLGLGQPDRAVEIMSKRHLHRQSASSQILQAQAELAAGNAAAARTLADRLQAEHPDMLSAWDLLVEVCLETADWDGAEAALRQRDARQPDSASGAYRQALLWQRRGDGDKALLWARSAVSRCERDALQPSIHLLRLLHTLHLTRDESDQAQAIADHLARRRDADLTELRGLLQAQPQTGEDESVRPGAEPAWPQETGPAAFPQVYLGAVTRTHAESHRLESALARHFQHTTFRPGQIDVLTSILRGRNVLAVMPTGAGKSLCYQLASLLLPGTTLVLSPLIALMKDQVDGLPDAIAVQAASIDHTLQGFEQAARLDRAARGDLKLLYVAPERLRQRSLLYALRRAGVSLLVVDEAHCVSLWGHDFRPDYRFIPEAWKELEHPTLLCMTATATPRVRDDVRITFGEMDLIATDVHRPNLRLQVSRFSREREKDQALVKLCQSMAGSGIVYARSRKKCEELARLLAAQGIRAVHYHAGISDRAGVQDQFMSGAARVVVATIAFGMGVDKPDVRFIIHYNLPKSLENYYQEAGRAGRDGLPAHCVLFYSPSERAVLSKFVKSDKLEPGFLRAVYAAVRRRLAGSAVGLVSSADLGRDVAADDTDIRVGVHFLETAGLLWRGFDLPRVASLNLLQSPAAAGGDFAEFVTAARLRPNQPISRSLVAICVEAGLDPTQIEAQLLEWSDQGWIDYRPSARDMLMALPPPPTGSDRRLAALLADHHAGLEGRIGELVAYANTTTCRHGFISRYFGGVPISHCQSCDNCVRGPTAVPPKPRPSAPPKTGSSLRNSDLAVILRAVEHLPFPLGRTGLAQALTGSSASPVQADRFPLFGALRRHTQKAIGQAVLHLIEQGLLEQRTVNGYPLLFATEPGGRMRDQWERAPTEHPDRAQTEDAPTPAPELLERLRAWRLQEARAAKLPPYYIIHDSVLKSIATSQPTSAEQLLAIKGVGPIKLEKYGQAILAAIASGSTSGR